MILKKDSQTYKKLQENRKELMPLYPFFKRYKEDFIAHFIDEIKKETGSHNIRENILKERASNFYDELFDFKTAASKSIAEEFMQVKKRGIAPLLLLQKLLSSLLLRLVSDYSDDREIFRYLTLLSDYFDAVLEYLKTLLQEDTERNFDRFAPLKEEEVEKWLPAGRVVRLMSVYKGIPIAYDGVADRSGSGSLVLQVPLERAIVAEYEGRVVCFDRRMEPFAIEMRIKRVAYRGKIAVMEVESPAWIESIVQRRKRVRVALNRPLKAKITALGRQFNVDVIDISAKGVCLQTDAGYGLPLYEQVEVTLPVPQEDGGVRNIVMRGTLQFVSTHDGSQRRYHIYLHANPRKEEILSAFVAKREIALMREIKAIAGRKRV